MVSTEKHPILEVIIVTQYEEVVQNLESFVTEIAVVSFNDIDRALRYADGVITAVILIDQDMVTSNYATLINSKGVPAAYISNDELKVTRSKNCLLPVDLLCTKYAKELVQWAYDKTHTYLQKARTSRKNQLDLMLDELTKIKSM
tara:strand:- start:22 stop:456 length:435 start_codon:yes stop_codon:yes gene_type:complete